MKIIPAYRLKRGMRFSFIPAAWHGPSIVANVRDSGQLVRVEFHNDQIVNQPGVWYGDPATKVRVLPTRRNSS